MRVVVNSLPKSGTHLLARVMILLGLIEFSPGLTGALVRKIEKNILTKWKKSIRKTPEMSPAGLPIDLDVSTNWIRKDWLQTYLAGIPDDSFITAHLPYSGDLSEFLTANGFRTIFIYRDPRDILVSYINFQKNREDYPFHEFFSTANDREQVQAVLDGLVSGETVLSPMADRLTRARGWLRDGNTLALRFEDLIGKAGYGDQDKQFTAVSRIADWCGINLSVDQIREIATQVFDPTSETFHKGTIGQWKQKIDQESLDDIMERCGDLIKEYGY